MKRQLKLADYQIPPTELAVNLLGKVLVGPNGAVGRIIETEAYGGGNDPASHGNRGQTPRNKVMFGRAGYLYVYFTYGMHYCCNVVASYEGECAAVLLRALEPMQEINKMKRARQKGNARKIKETDLCSGPAKLTQALGISAKHNGVDLTLPVLSKTKTSSTTKTSSRNLMYIYDDGFKLETIPGTRGKIYLTSPRIGISSGQDLLWRYFF